VAPDTPPAPDKPEPKTLADAPPAARWHPDVPRPAPPVPVPPAAALIPLSRSQLATADISAAQPAARPSPTGPMMGPPDTSAPGDSQRIAGSGPHGEPLYAARWYREPGDAELAGYLSTASGPGYALINCRTVPDFRVEDCVLVDEYPSGAGLGRAVLAAAWQFRVRPPRVGGRSLVGEWVRIRISYEQRGG
jgi:protein TonB